MRASYSSIDSRVKTQVRFASGSLCAALILVMALASIGAATPLYESFEFTATSSTVTGNLHRTFATATFSKGSRSFDVDGFFDGNNTWRFRFMPDELGTWNYSWNLNGQSGSGSFECTALSNAKNHGHVHRDPNYPRYLVYDDGSPHYWYGGCWISEGNTASFISYLDACENYRHNGLLIKIALYPLDWDKFTWDLNMVQEMETMVQEMGKRGIYCQLNIFDTWAKGGTNGDDQVFNVWKSGDEDAKENYIRTIVARFAGYYNVYWELGNEMEHSPNSGSAFVTQANAKYIPWIRKYDPYGLPIGLSEGVWQSADVDIGFLHQTGGLPPANPSGNRPTIMNELVSGGECGSMWKDEVIRDPCSRLSYRRTFWRMFTYGGSGSSEATWLDYNQTLNQAVLNVMADHMRFRNFIDDLPVSINQMDRNPGLVLNGPGSISCRAKLGVAYVCYFLGSASAGEVTMNLSAGDYTAKWYNPSTGEYVAQSNVPGSSNTKINHPSFSEDIALVVVASGALDKIPPLPPTALNAKAASENQITLIWIAPGPASDGDTASSYVILRNGQVVGESQTIEYVDMGLSESTTYSYTVKSLDDMNNQSITGATANLSTTADQTPPTLVSARASGNPNQVVVTFSEPLEEASANNPANYVIAPQVPVHAAVLQVDQITVLLSTGAHTEATAYTLSVSNVKDRSAAGNVIAAGTTAQYEYIGQLTVTGPNVVGSSNAYVLDTLRAGLRYYTDRSFTIQSPVPPALDGQLMIKTPNSDKANQAGTVFTIDVNVPVTVYVAVDSRGNASANWMDAYTDADMTISTTDATLKVIKRTAGPGEISFGGNHDSGNEGAQSNYIVVLVPLNGTDVLTPQSPITFLAGKTGQYDISLSGRDLLLRVAEPSNRPGRLCLMDVQGKTWYQEKIPLSQGIYRTKLSFAMPTQPLWIALWNGRHSCVKRVVLTK